MRGGALFNGKEGRGDFRKNPSLWLKEDWWVFEKSHHYGKRKTGVVSKESLWQKKDGSSFGQFFAKRGCVISL